METLASKGIPEHLPAIPDPYAIPPADAGIGSGSHAGVNAGGNMGVKADVKAGVHGVPSTSPDAVPSTVALSPLEQAHALRDQVEGGDHSLDTLQAAVQQYDQLLAEPPIGINLHRAEVLNDLGSLHWLIAQQTPDPTECCRHLHQSQAHYEAALNLPEPDPSAETQIRLYSNLGSVYRLLASHGQGERYLEKAVRAFHRALQQANSETDSDTYATLQTHLGTAYWSLAQYRSAPTPLHRAIAAYQEALIYRPAHQNPVAYAQIQNNLGIAYWSLSQHERPAMLLEQAIAAYRDVLAYRPVGMDAPGHAATQTNLGTAYWDLGRQHPQGSTAQHHAWERAIAAYQSALEVVARMKSSASLSFDPWATHHSLAVVHDQLAVTLTAQGELQRHHWKQAMQHYAIALEGWRELESPLVTTALQGIIQTLQHQERALGLDFQRRSLTRIPAHWLPEIWRHL
jgi:tetratricopeptide (TPR) repeat protein